MLAANHILESWLYTCFFLLIFLLSLVDSRFLLFDLLVLYTFFFYSETLPCSFVEEGFLVKGKKAGSHGAIEPHNHIIYNQDDTGNDVDVLLWLGSCSTRYGKNRLESFTTTTTIICMEKDWSNSFSLVVFFSLISCKVVLDILCLLLRYWILRWLKCGGMNGV